MSWTLTKKLRPEEIKSREAVLGERERERERERDRERET